MPSPNLLISLGLRLSNCQLTTVFRLFFDYGVKQLTLADNFQGRGRPVELFLSLTPSTNLINTSTNAGQIAPTGAVYLDQSDVFRECLSWLKVSVYGVFGAEKAQSVARATL